MKGLIIKDALCLKKNLKMFVLVTLGVIALAVMFVLSTRYGNLSKSIANWNSEDTMSKEMMLVAINMAMHVILFIPMAFVSNVIDCFVEDKKADFSKTVFSMPVSNIEIVGARFASMLIYTVVALLCSGIAAGAISVASDTIVFKEIFSSVLVFAGVLLVYVSIIMPCIYFFGAEKATVIAIIPFVAGVIGCFFLLGEKMNGVSEAESEMYMLKLMNDFIELLTHKGPVLIGVAVLCLIAAFFISVKILEKKRGRLL